MTSEVIMNELTSMGSGQRPRSASVKKILMRHGAREPLFGVKVGDMKRIVKRVKKGR